MTDSSLHSSRRLFFNGNILSFQESVLTQWHWLHVEGGVVRKGGAGNPPDDLMQCLNEGECQDLDGAVVLPGLGDSHIHIGAIGRSRQAIDLEGCVSIAEMQERTRNHLSTQGDSSEMIEGNHWDQDLLGRLPTKEDLDVCSLERPLVFYRRCWHICVVNSATMAICGITSATPDVEGGQVDRDADGNPTGILREGAMESLLKPLSDRDDPLERQQELLLDGLRECVQRGITAVQSNDGKVIGQISTPWQAYSALAAEGKLPCRVFLTVPWTALGQPETPNAPVQHPSGLLSCDRVKLWTDGALGASTAAMLEPYSDDRVNVGILQMSAEMIDEAMGKAKAANFRVEAHAIGDHAATELVTAFERFFSPEDRPVLTHCQILNASLVNRMSKMGVIANVQPQFAPSDKPIVPLRLGEDTERFRFSYPWKTLLREGVRLAGGSDAPVEAPAPLVGMADAMDNVIHDAERLSFAEALEMYTVGSAFAARAEDRLGQLAAGYQADLVVLSLREPAPELTAAQLRSADVLEVYVGGCLVHKGVPAPPPAPSDARRPARSGDGAGKSGLLRAWRRGRCPCCVVRSPVPPA